MLEVAAVALFLLPSQEKSQKETNTRQKGWKGFIELFLGDS